MTDYAMFSKAGNAAVDRLVQRILEMPMTASSKEISAALDKGMDRIAKAHPEVWDTDVRDHIYSVLVKKSHGRLDDVVDL